MLTLINRLLRHAGLMVVPRPYSSAKMLREHANIGESFHPSQGDRTVRWMREVADRMESCEDLYTSSLQSPR
jgi:hypothetical protein